ncbi:FtsX-like permease family protein [Streptomyces coeruleorubidus]|uniref:FtsX-like permease family protein n=1 Tax=Streptomyces coeruleorubidus TaxID=116188 RepID=UPI003700E786
MADYTGISVADTIVMATSDRARDLAAPRPAGATRWQVLRLTAAEALTVVAAGALLSLLVAAVDLAGMAGAPARLSAPATIKLPWQALGTTMAVCALLGTTTAVCALLPTASALAPAALALRRRPAELAGVRE